MEMAIPGGCLMDGIRLQNQFRQAQIRKITRSLSAVEHKAKLAKSWRLVTKERFLKKTIILMKRRLTRLVLHSQHRIFQEQS